MNRRELILATGAFAVSGASAAAPDAGTGAAKSPNLIELASSCIEIGEECQAHCFQQFAAGDTSLAGCARSVTMMLAMCRALVTAAALASRRSRGSVAGCAATARRSASHTLATTTSAAGAWRPAAPAQWPVRRSPPDSVPEPDVEGAAAHAQ